MKDNKGNKTGSKSCVACEKPVVNINNEYINETREVIIDGDEVFPASPTVKGLVNQSTAVADISVSDATDEATAVALANANKSKINEFLSALRTAGIIAT